MYNTLKKVLVLFTLILIPVFSHGDQSYSSLAGTWKLNKEASYNLDELLKFQGRSYLERRMVKSMDMTQEVTISSNTVAITVMTSINKMHMKLYVDGKAHKEKNKEGEDVSIKCSPITNGIVIESKDEKGIITLTKRYIEKNRMINQITMTSPDGKSVTAKRVFDRIN